MTRCEFHTEGERITGFSVSGHSDYDEPGKDIVCAAVSAVVTMAEATINDVCGAKAKVRVKDGEDNRITLTLPTSCDEEDTVSSTMEPYMGSNIWLVVRSARILKPMWLPRPILNRASAMPP